MLSKQIVLIMCAGMLASCKQTDAQLEAPQIRPLAGPVSQNPNQTLTPQQQQQFPVNPPASVNPNPSPPRPLENKVEGPSFLDRFKDLIKKLTPQKSPQSVISYGGDKVFHIGDDHYTDSSCRSEIAGYPLKGTVYDFKFKVLNDQTTVDMKIERICGIDYPDSNVVSLYKGKSLYDSMFIPVNTAFIEIPGLILDKGTYTLKVESRLGSLEDPGDHDNFVVGQVWVRGSALLENDGVEAN